MSIPRQSKLRLGQQCRHENEMSDMDEKLVYIFGWCVKGDSGVPKKHRQASTAAPKETCIEQEE
ncbi:hypothetical protein K439DRAFT_1641823 [Ramaria rubella]|nr:hypothetical protein K439DRAFT_1641823 [Ramaria rubella]